MAHHWLTTKCGLFLCISYIHSYKYSFNICQSDFYTSGHSIIRANILRNVFYIQRASDKKSLLLPKEMAHHGAKLSPQSVTYSPVCVTFCTTKMPGSACIPRKWRQRMRTRQVLFAGMLWNNYATAAITCMFCRSNDMMRILQKCDSYLSICTLLFASRMNMGSKVKKVNCTLTHMYVLKMCNQR